MGMCEDDLGKYLLFYLILWSCSILVAPSSQFEQNKVQLSQVFHSIAAAGPP